jgi:polar amino acid transport system substrate-binding protein
MKIKSLIAATASALVLAAAAQAEQVRIGIAAEPYPPFMSVDASGTWVGWEIEMIDAVCKASKMDCVLTPVAWDGIIPSLTGNQIDVIVASMSITEDRQKVIDFSDVYYNTPAVIVADKSLDVEATPEGLAGKILGVQASSIHATYAQKYFPDAAEIRIYQRQDDANQDLASGRIDAVQADSIAMSDFVEAAGATCCEIKGSVAHDETILGSGVGAGVRKGEDELREKLNQGIAAILADGTHAEITSRYFNTSIYSE